MSRSSFDISANAIRIWANWLVPPRSVLWQIFNSFKRSFSLRTSDNLTIARIACSTLYTLAYVYLKAIKMFVHCAFHTISQYRWTNIKCVLYFKPNNNIWRPLKNEIDLFFFFFFDFLFSCHDSTTCIWIWME